MPRSSVLAIRRICIHRKCICAYRLFIDSFFDMAATREILKTTRTGATMLISRQSLICLLAGVSVPFALNSHDLMLISSLSSTAVPESHENMPSRTFVPVESLLCCHATSRVANQSALVKETKGERCLVRREADTSTANVCVIFHACNRHERRNNAFVYPR